MAAEPAEFPLRQSGLFKASFRGDASYYFVRAIYDAGGSFAWRQPSYQLVVMLQGRADITINGDRVTLLEGQGILMHPGWEVSYAFTKDQRTTHAACLADSALLEKAELDQLEQVRGVHRVPPAVHSLISEGLSASVTAGTHLHAAYTLMAKACLLHFAASHSASPALGHRRHPSLIRAFAALEADPTTFNSAGALARRCGISVSRLRQVFREAGYESPSAMIWRIKIEHAVRMIRSTGLSLAEIAEHSGFTNPFHLSRSVKKHTGQSPKKIRLNEHG